MKAKEWLKQKGIHPTEPIYWDTGEKIIYLDELMDEYISSQLEPPVMQKIAEEKECYFIVERECTHPEVYYTENDAKNSMQYKLGGKIIKTYVSNFSA